MKTSCTCKHEAKITNQGDIETVKPQNMTETQSI